MAHSTKSSSHSHSPSCFFSSLGRLRLQSFFSGRLLFRRLSDMPTPFFSLFYSGRLLFAACLTFHPASLVVCGTVICRARDGKASCGDTVTCAVDGHAQLSGVGGEQLFLGKPARRAFEPRTAAAGTARRDVFFVATSVWPRQASGVGVRV